MSNPTWISIRQSPPDARSIFIPCFQCDCTQILMMPCTKTHLPLSPWWVEFFLKFERCFCSKTDHFAADFKHLSEMLIYIILLTLERLKHWNQRVLTKIIRVQYHQDNYLFINVACRQDERVRQFSPISGCIEDDLKFGAVML